MLFLKKLTNLFLSVLLVFQSFAPALTVMAEGEDMITIDSDWKGTVFGDVGGGDVFCKFEVHSIATKSTQYCHPIISF